MNTQIEKAIQAYNARMKTEQDNEMNYKLALNEFATKKLAEISLTPDQVYGGGLARFGSMIFKIKRDGGYAEVFRYQPCEKCGEAICTRYGRGFSLETFGELAINPDFEKHACPMTVTTYTEKSYADKLQDALFDYVRDMIYQHTGA
jgi:hypothetical protein